MGLAGALGLPTRQEDEEVDKRAAAARVRGSLFFEDTAGLGSSADADAGLELKIGDAQTATDTIEAAARKAEFGSLQAGKGKRKVQPAIALGRHFQPEKVSKKA